MIDIDFIKWMCEKADDFDFYEGDFIDDNYIETPCLQQIDQLELDCDLWVKSIYPLLIQRSIRGAVKKLHESSDIEKIQIIDAFCSDEIGEQWLKYRYEQEKN